MTTSRINMHAKKLAEIAAHSADYASKNPNDPWALIIAKNQQSAADQARHSAINEELEKAGQLIDFRFIGPRANGSIPIDSFIKIFDPLSRALKHTAQRLLTGKDELRVNNMIAELLNLKLAGMSYGSTRVIVSGSTTPDLTGTNLLQKTLDETFKLLNSSNENFYDAVDTVGGKSAATLLEALQAIDSSGLSAEFAWISPNGPRYWNGTTDELLRLKTLLNSLQKPKIYEEILHGYVSKIFESGKIELRTNDGKIPITYPLNLINQVQRLSISVPAKLKVITSAYYDNVLKKDIFKRNLIDVI